VHDGLRDSLQRSLLDDGIETNVHYRIPLHLEPCNASAPSRASGARPWHPLYALDTLFEAAGDDRAFRRFAELTGTLNVLRLPDRVE